MALNGVSSRLSSYYTNYKRTWKYAIMFKDVAENYRFEKMTQQHLPLLMDLGRDSFKDDSITLGTGVTFDDCKTGMEWVFSYAIVANSVMGVSDICYDKKTNKPVGFRMVDPYYKDQKMAPFRIPDVTFNNKEKAFFGLLDGTYAKIWDCYPNEKVMVRPTLVFIDPAHRTLGLSRAWIEYGLDFPTMSKQTGANICATLCTSRKTKGWFEKNGHTLAHTTGPNVTNAEGETVALPEGPLRVYAADMHTVKTINVKPCWEMMKAVGMMPK